LTFLQALAYFVREAATSLRRSWKVGLLAVLTMAVSLAVGGGLLLAGENLARQVERWRDEAKVVVYLRPDAPAEERAEAVAAAHDADWAAAVEEVGAEEAAARFRRAFPSLADLVAPPHGAPDAETAALATLPPSIELDPAPGAERDRVAAWADRVRALPAVDAVDDDRDWLAQLDGLVALVRGAGLALGGVLLGAAVFTIAAVIRLTAYIYQEEIAVMRLVGATEFFIRGPFYAEGLLQGLLGGLLALAALAATWHLALPTPDDLLTRALTAHFLTWRQAAALVTAGAAAGLTGALLSLRREKLGETMETSPTT